MTHLPECPAQQLKRAEAPMYGLACICDALRACKQRVIGNLSLYTWTEGYAAGHLDALEEAETAVSAKQPQIAKEVSEHIWGLDYPSDEGDCCAEVAVNSVLDAIRALKEQ